jgi:hypothetical protein
VGDLLMADGPATLGVERPVHLTHAASQRRACRRHGPNTTGPSVAASMINGSPPQVCVHV